MKLSHITFLIFLFFLAVSLYITQTNNLFEYKQQNAFVTSWSKDTLKEYSPFVYLQELLSSPANGNYKILYVDYEDTQTLAKNEFHLINSFKFRFPSKNEKEQYYLWQLESPITIDINPQHFTPYFKKIFTYFKAATNGKNIIYTPIPYNYPTPIKTTNLDDKNILLTQVSTFYVKNTPYNIYNLRRKAVVWFLENHPQDFIFYGSLWHKIKPLVSQKNQKYFDSQYKGYVANKLKAISKAKFALAFENVDFQDYVSEKIFDVMTAGTVPIYMGAPNITDYVPAECFISYRDFLNFSKLYQFISNMPDEEYFKYINCINTFLENPTKHPNHWKNVAELILKHIQLHPTSIDWNKTAQKIFQYFKNIF